MSVTIAQSCVNCVNCVHYSHETSLSWMLYEWTRLCLCLLLKAVWTVCTVCTLAMKYQFKPMFKPKWIKCVAFLIVKAFWNCGIKIELPFGNFLCPLWSYFLFLNRVDGHNFVERPQSQVHQVQVVWQFAMTSLMRTKPISGLWLPSQRLPGPFT